LKIVKDYRPGEIVLLSFPFADAAGAKRRPALVVLDVGDQDVLVVRVSGQVAQTAFDVVIQDWQRAGLVLPSVARVHKVATLEKRLVQRRLGTLTRDDWQRVSGAIRQMFEPQA
jgi:mRNA interferase MazF